MARIRTIKPDFWEDEKIGLLSHGARLLFLGCLNLADDEGLLRWNNMYLGSSVFPYDDIKPETVTKWMDELESNNLIYMYQSGQAKQKLGWIINFHKHQRIDKPQPSKFNPPPVHDRRVRLVYCARDNYTCQICGGPIDMDAPTGICGSKAPSLDHIKHKVSGGIDHPSNIRASHLGCNKSRSDREDSEIGNTYADLYRMNRSYNNSENDSKNDSKNGSTTEKEGKRKRKGEGRESPTTPPGPVIKSIDDLMTECLSDRLNFVEHVMRQNKITELQLNNAMSAFNSHLKSGGELVKQDKDYRFHFQNWIKKQDLKQFRINPQQSGSNESVLKRIGLT